MTLEEARLRVVEAARAFRRIYASHPSNLYRIEVAWVALRETVDTLESLQSAAGFIR